MLPIDSQRTFLNGHFSRLQKPSLLEDFTLCCPFPFFEENLYCRQEKGLYMKYNPFKGCLNSISFKTSSTVRTLCIVSLFA